MAKAEKSQMSDQIIAKITEICEDRFKESDLSSCFLVDVEIHNKKVDVYMDSDVGVHYKDCQIISRVIEEYLDGSQVLGEKYTLNVSSPGVDRPLKYQRQYPRNKGRNIEIKLRNGSFLNGVLTEVSEDSISVTTKKTKKKESMVHHIKYDDISHSKILVTF